MKKMLRYLFELRFFPNVSSFLFDNETWLRLRPIKKFLQEIESEKRKKIIDVGAGTGRLELQLNRTDITIYDQDENSIAIAKKHFENAIVGTGAKMEFDDDTFDWAISIHTLEHIPRDQREFFILEMIRISKEGVFLNFPEGKYADQLCHNFLDALKKNGLPPNRWTEEHLEMGLPMVDEINSILAKQDKFKFEYKLTRNYKAENAYWTKMRMSKSMLFKYISSPFFAVYKYLNVDKAPTVEMILVGTKTGNRTSEVLKKV